MEKSDLDWNPGDVLSDAQKAAVDEMRLALADLGRVLEDDLEDDECLLEKFLTARSWGACARSASRHGLATHRAQWWRTP